MRAYKLEISLIDIFIWREIIVPADLTFEELHILIQYAFGWQDSHLYEFDFKNVQFTADEEELLRMEYYKSPQGSKELERMEKKRFFVNRTNSLRRVTENIDKYLENKKEFKYTYDFGDNWEHKIKVLEIIENHKKEYPQVLKFKGTCPPENCGGIPGYEDFMNIMNDESHPEHEKMKFWAEEQGYATYNIDEINRVFKEAFEGIEE